MDKTPTFTVDFTTLPTSTSSTHKPALNIKLPSGTAELDAYLWLPPNSNSKTPRSLPIVFLGHGLGAVQYMGLTGIAQTYTSTLPIAVLTFDYTGFGKSIIGERKMREYIDIEGQKQDWRNVLQYVRSGAVDDAVDTSNICIGGSSFGGGMVLAIASEPEQSDIRCVIAQVPFVGMLESVTAISIPVQLKALAYGIVDKVVVSMIGRDRWQPVRIPIVAKYGEAALMSTPSSWDGYTSLNSSNILKLYAYGGLTPARFILESLAYRPLLHSDRIKSNVLVVVATHDDLIPLWASRRVLPRIPNVEYHELDTGHFDVYPNCKSWKPCIELHIDFLRRKLGL